MAKQFRRLFRAEFETVRETLSELDDWLDWLGMRADPRGSAELVLAEVLNNIVEHAYGEGAPGDVELSVGHSQKFLSCRLTDWGRPMPRSELPEGKSAALDVDLAELPEGGFGWFLIRQMVEELHYHRDNDRNVVSFRLPLS